MKLATTTGDFFKYGFDVEESIAAILEAGFKYIDYSFTFDYNNRTGMFGNSWEAYSEKLLKLAQDKGFKFVQAHSPTGKVFAGGEQFVDDTKRSIKAAAALGIPNIVVHSGYLKGLSKKETFERNKEFYEELLPVAESCNINVLTENFDKMCDPDTYWIDNAQDLKELIDYINHPLLKACWDTGHGNLQKLPQHEALKLLGNRVAAVHIQDNAGDYDDHILPFCGTLSMDSVMLGLKEIGFDGYFTFEADNTPYLSWRKPEREYDGKCFKLPVDFRKRFEKIMYDMGKYVLTQYGCFEE